MYNRRHVFEILHLTTITQKTENYIHMLGLAACKASASVLGVYSFMGKGLTKHIPGPVLRDYSG